MSDASELAHAVRDVIPAVDYFTSTLRAAGQITKALSALAELERRAGREVIQLAHDPFVFYVPVPLPPAESCAHAVARFRDALLLLTKRHEVEVEVGGISPGSCGGIEDLPDAGEVDEFREARAWDAIEKWQDRALDGAVRGAEVRKLRRPTFEKARYSVVLDDRVSAVNMEGMRCLTNVSRPFRGATRLEALEAAAAGCEVWR